MTDSSELETSVDEPSAEDFEAAEEERPEAGAKPVVVRILRLAVVVLVVVSLVLYLADPVSILIHRISNSWSQPDDGPRRVPAVPEPDSGPGIRV